MKKVFTPILFLIILSSLLITGCTGTGIATSWPGISYADNRVYMAYSSQVLAINPENGSVVWRYPEKANAKMMFYAAPAVSADGLVVVGDYTNTIHALNTSTGAQTWSYTTGNRIIASAVISEKTILVPSTDHFLYALNEQGQLVWKFETDRPIWARPLVMEGVVYQPGMDRKLYAIQLTNGTAKWELDLGSATIGSPVIDDNGILYVGTLGNDIVAVDTISGKINWKYTNTSGIWANMVLKENTLYFGSLDGNFTALDITTQKPVWQYKADGAIVSPPALLEDRLMFSSENGSLNILDYSGAVIGTPVMSEKLYAAPILNGDKVLVGITGSNDKVMSAVDQNGIQVWSFQPPK